MSSFTLLYFVLTLRFFALLEEGDATALVEALAGAGATGAAFSSSTGFGFGCGAGSPLCKKLSTKEATLPDRMYKSHFGMMTVILYAFVIQRAKKSIMYSLVV